MKRFPMAASLALLLTAAQAQGGQIFECNEQCHSKKPAMVRMHQAVKNISCFDCHKMGEKLMGKGVPKNREAQLKRRVSEPVCVGCHDK